MRENGTYYEAFWNFYTADSAVTTPVINLRWFGFSFFFSLNFHGGPTYGFG